MMITPQENINMHTEIIYGIIITYLNCVLSSYNARWLCMFIFIGKLLLRQMLQQAKDEGLTINVRHAKVLFCGAAKAGKTSFSHLLRNKEHDTDYKSTPAGDAQQVLISDKVNVVGTNWISLDSKLETQQITNRLIAKLRNQKDDKPPVHQNIRRNFKINLFGKKQPKDVQSHQQTATKATHNISKDVSNSKSRKNIPEIDLSAATPNSQLALTDDETPDYSEPTSGQINIQEQMMMSADVNAPVSELESIPKTWDLFTLLDTGGQPEFINMLPAINSFTAVTFIVLNISDGKDCLNNKVVAQYQQEGYNYNECTLKYTNKHLLKCLFSSVKAAAMKKRFLNLGIVKQLTKDKHPKPVIYVIGTCVDKLKKNCENYMEDVRKIDEEVTKLVNEIKDKDVLEFQCDEKSMHVFPVDNTISRGPPQEGVKCETAEIVQSIHEHCNTILRDKAQYEIPISWFILELELRSNDKVCIPLTEVKIICDKIMPSHRQMKMNQIKEILKFYHSFGMLLYFSEVDGMNNYVITNPQWLFLNLTKIIMCKFENNAKRRYDLHTIEEMNKGICSLELLGKLDLNLQGIKLESFIKLLVHLKVIAPVNNAYFIPTILPPCDDEYIFTERECGRPAAFTNDGQYIDVEVEPLVIQFTSGTIPRGLFGFLIIQLLQDNPNTYELYGKNDNILRRCSDLLCFYVKPYWYVSLHDKIFYLELQVRVTGNEPSYHYEAQTIVTKSLKKVCDEFNWEFSDCRYGFLCREDPNDDHLTLLPTNPPYKRKIPKYTTCCNQRATHLSNAHMIWFKVC